MAATTLTDVIVPELFNPYVVNRTMELSDLVQSGIITNNSEFDALASQAAPTVNMPFFEDLTGESEQVIEGEDLEENKITSNKDVAAILRRAKMWAATDLSAALAGSEYAAGGDAAGVQPAGYFREVRKRGKLERQRVHRCGAASGRRESTADGDLHAQRHGGVPEKAEPDRYGAAFQ